MSKIYYGDNTSRLIPAPLVNISKTFQKGGNGEIIGTLFNITLTGTIVAWMGSPQSQIDLSHDDTGFVGAFYTTSGYPADEAIPDIHRLSAIQRKQEAIRFLFSVEGKKLEIQGAGGGASVICYPRNFEINFPEGIWYERCEYTITMECDKLLGGPFAQEDTYLQYISDASEEWSIDTNEEAAETLGVPKTYSLSHSVSANGKRFYDDTGLVKEPWEQAKTFVLSKLGYDASIILSSGVLNLPTYYQGLNHARSENINKQGGSYSVTENWVLASGTATEDFIINTSDSLESLFKQVSIDGNVKGYDQRDANLNITTSKWDNAVSKFTTVSALSFIRAQQFSGLSLNITPITETIGRNPIQGTISYTSEYNNRPMTLVSGVKSESISVVDNLRGEAFATVFVLGRAKGPVLQALSTKPASTRSLSIELVFPPTTYTDRSIATIRGLVGSHKSDIQHIIDAVNPSGNGFTTVFQEPEQETYNITDSRYAYNTQWTMEL
jgi:hypothetical protein